MAFSWFFWIRSLRGDDALLCVCLRGDDGKGAGSRDCGRGVRVPEVVAGPGFAARVSILGLVGIGGYSWLRVTGWLTPTSAWLAGPNHCPRTYITWRVYSRGRGFF